jgi:hypothetical protein
MQGGGVTPEMLTAARKADQEHAAVMSQQGIDLIKINNDHEAAMARISADSADSARKREMAVRDRTPAHLAYILIGGFLSTSIAQLAAVMFFPLQAAAIPPQGWLLIGNISGYLAFEAKQATGYYFGTTSQSKAKDDTINKAVSAN